MKIKMQLFTTLLIFNTIIRVTKTDYSPPQHYRVKPHGCKRERSVVTFTNTCFLRILPKSLQFYLKVNKPKYNITSKNMSKFSLFSLDHGKKKMYITFKTLLKMN